MNSENKEFLLEHLTTMLNDLDFLIDQKKITLAAAVKNNFFSPTEKVSMNSNIIAMVQKKIIVRNCIEELKKT